MTLTPRYNFREHVGECVLYVWAERVREFLQDLADQDVELEEILKSLEGANLGDSGSDGVSGGGGSGTVVSSISCPEITSGDLIVDRKSVFQPHLARVTSVDEVPVVLSRLKENRKIATATHNIYAYRITLPGAVLAQDCEDDGETKAGSRMLHLMGVLDVVNVLVIVTRWYGGCHIGPDRFKHINAATRSILEICGFLDDHQDSKSGDIAGKKDKKSVRKSKS
ncbi:Impact N-terminal [Trinorchestia longiramus]|nr:Impact N-terminal [Trinorchestia longiramus]